MRRGEPAGKESDYCDERRELQVGEAGNRVARRAAASVSGAEPYEESSTRDDEESL